MSFYVSIVIPIYNVKNYLDECIDSVIKQYSKEMEIILVNDGSTDGSNVICDNYKQKYVNLNVIHKENGGLSDARNTGIKTAQGKYILFIDGDDFIENGSIEKLIEDCKNQKEPDVLFLKAYKLFPDGTREQLDESLSMEKIIGKNRNNVLKYIASLHKFPGSACTKMVRRSLLIENELYFEYGKKSEDIDWTKKLLFAAETFGVSSINYYYYRQARLGSITNSVDYSNFRNLSDVIDSWKTESVVLENEEKNILLSFAAYEYKVLLAIYIRLNRKEKNIARKWLESNKWLLKHKNDKHIFILRYFISLFGFELTTKLLKIYISNRTVIR